MINGYRWYLQEKSPRDVLHKLIEIFASEGWFNKKPKMRYKNERYRISCSEEGSFAYQINGNCCLGPGVPGWPVCIIRKDYVYDESGIPDITSTKLDMHDWLNIIANQNFELI